MTQERERNGWGSVGKVLALCLVIIGVPTGFVWTFIFNHQNELEARVRVMETNQVRLEERLRCLDQGRKSSD